MSDRLFTSFQKDHSPLEYRLDEYARTARDNVQGVSKSAFTSFSDEELLAGLLPNWTLQTRPRLARLGSPKILDEPIPATRRAVAGSGRVSVWRWMTTFAVVGNRELLASWPARFDGDAIDDNPSLLPVGKMAWSAGADGPLVLLDVLGDEDPHGVAVPTERFVAAAAFLDKMLAAINAEVEEYDERLRSELLAALLERRERLGAIASKTDEIVRLLHVPLRALEVVEDRPLGQPSRSTSEAILLGPILHERTFADLVAVTKKWGVGVARYPEAFHPLREEILSSLLVPALNVAFDTAHREVFSNKGKTDIWVESARHNREKAAFFAEAKIWNGPGAVPKHLAQMFGYSNGLTDELMLLYYVKAKRLQAITKRCREALERSVQFVEFDERSGDEVAVVTHPDYEQRIAITPVFIHIPPA